MDTSTPSCPVGSGGTGTIRTASAAPGLGAQRRGDDPLQF